MGKTSAKGLQPESAVSHHWGRWLFAAAIVALTYGAYIPARYGLAIAQITRNQLGPAEPTLPDLLQVRPDSPEALSALGGLLIKTGRLAEAQACLERALQVRPGFPAAVRQMELLQQELQR